MYVKKEISKKNKKKRENYGLAHEKQPFAASRIGRFSLTKHISIQALKHRITSSVNSLHLVIDTTLKTYKDDVKERG